MKSFALYDPYEVQTFNAVVIKVVVHRLAQVLGSSGHQPLKQS